MDLMYGLFNAEIGRSILIITIPVTHTSIIEDNCLKFRMLKLIIIEYQALYTTPA